MKKLARRAVPVLAILTGAGCAAVGIGAEAEEGPEELFRLVEVGGSALPVGYAEEDGCREEIVSGTLALEADGEWELRMTKREICGGETEEDADEEEGSYTRDGQSLRFTGPVDDDADDDAGAGEIEIETLTEGTLSGDVLTARLRDGTTVLFRRS